MLSEQATGSEVWEGLAITLALSVGWCLFMLALIWAVRVVAGVLRRCRWR